jgi:4-aminobutyrate aminotransferase
MHSDLLARHQAVMPSWVALYYREPIALVKGEGRHVEDAEGNRYLDCFGGILTTSTAYALPEVTAAVQRQAENMMHTSTLYLIEQQVELAEEIARLSGIPGAKVFFCASGTEANETALLLATQYRKSNQVLAIRNSYHGRSFGAMAITGNRGWRASALAPFNVSYVECGYRHLDDAAFNAACADDLRSVLQTTTSGDVACMIAEPIQGVGGFATPPDGWLGEYARICADEGILMISDEVQTGWGRTGEHFWGYQAHGFTPDIMTFAKGIGNGLSIGGVIARPEIMDCLAAGSISTFGGNPLSTAASLANLKYMIDNDLQSNAARIGSVFFDGLRAELVSGQLPMVGDLRGKGMMIGIELVVPGTTDPDPAAASEVLEVCRDRGVLIGKGGLNGNVLRMAPPMTMTEDEAAHAVEVLSGALRDVQASLHPSFATATGTPMESVRA